MKFANRWTLPGAVAGWTMAAMVGFGVCAVAADIPDAALHGGPIDPAVVAPAEQLGKAFTMVAAHISPAVVSVFSMKKVSVTQPGFSVPFGGLFGGQVPQIPERRYQGVVRGLGSGIILDKQGHILTNNHVVQDVDDITVQLADKRRFDAKVVGTDPKTDVAVIQLKGKLPDDLPTATLGDSDAMPVGSLVLAIGAPFGLMQTVTEGIISATGRSDVGIADYEDFLQTDAAINPGNSGGPLVNMRGEVIGMNSAIATSSGQFAGVGFSIPSNMIKVMLPRLVKGETIVRGQLGVVIQEMTPDLAKQFGLEEPRGVLVSQVNEGSPAAAAGLKPGDVILQYNGEEVTGVRELRNLVSATAPGTKASIRIIRDGKEQTLTASVGNQSAEPQSAQASSEEGANLLSDFGLTVESLTPDMARQLKAGVEQGAVIVGVSEGSPAALAGLQQGDVIVEADRRKITGADDLEQTLDKAKNKERLLLRIVRQGSSIYVVMQKAPQNSPSAP